MPKEEIEPAPAVPGVVEKAVNEPAANEPNGSKGSQTNRAPDKHPRTLRLSPSAYASDGGDKDIEGASKPAALTDDEPDEEFMNLADSVDAASSLAYRPGKPGYRGRLWVFSNEEWEEMQGILESDGTTSLTRESRVDDLDSVFNVRVAIPTKPRKYRSLCWLPILDPFSKFVIIWSNFLMVFDLTYTAFFLPISVGFQTDLIDFTAESDIPMIFMLVVDVLAAIVFTGALAMGFHTGFIGQYNLRQSLVMDGGCVAKFYNHKGSFFIDLISCVAFIIEVALIPVRMSPDSIGSAYWVLDFLQLLRMVRLLALLYTVQKILLQLAVGQNEGNGSQKRQFISNIKIYILIIAYILFFLINAVACFWFFIGSCYADNNIVNWIAYAQLSNFERPWGNCYLVNYKWVNQGGLITADIPGCEDYTAADFPGLSFLFAYTLSLYWSVTTLTTVGYGDITPQNSGEILTAMAVMMLGIGVFALLIGSIQEVFANASETALKASFIRSKLVKVDKWMSQRKLPSGIRGSIRRFYHDAWIQRHKADLEVEIFNDLPQQLQNQVATHLTDHILHKTPIVKEIPADARALMASKLRPITIGVGEDICEQGEDADRLWILQSGVMVAMYGRLTKSEIAEAPCLIGETTILQDVDPEFERRPCSYRATEICNLWELRIRDLQVIQRLFPEAEAKLHEGASEHLLSRAGIKTAKGSLDSEAINFLVDEVQQANHTEKSGPSHHSVMQSHPSSAALRHGLVSMSDGNIEVDGIGEVRMSGILNLALDAVSDEEEREAYKKKIAGTSVPESPISRFDAPNTSSVPADEDATLRQLLCEVLFRTKSLEVSVAEMRRNARFGATGSPRGSPKSPIHSQIHSISSPQRSPVVSPQQSRFLRERASVER